MARASKSYPRTGWNPDYCDQVVEFMGRGYSLTAFAGEVGVSRATLDKWVAKRVTFAQAVERGQARRARLLEDRLLAGRGSGAFGLHMEALKTAAPEDWRGESGGVKAKASERRGPDVQLDLPDNGRDG